MRAVFNSSPIIILGKLGYLANSIALFGEVYVPEGVLLEVTAKEDEVSVLLRELTERNLISVMKIEKIAELEYPGLHRGELEAIALAKRLDAMVVLDDLKARKAARLEGLRVIGTLGMLRILNEAGILKDSPRELLEILTRVGFRIRPELFYRVMGEEE
ncbi:DUF3368 domain-containing protein [Thermococcus sp.]|uniref:DUF3368 domain-containing protein n=1 Tax=Thermococcus sp. TaxID=35749 RepID=UPI002637F2EF|nr:DUF3368 domain-containing protein [Thermococcus sp.]